ncbi:hypothetical protein B0H12DRAFT_1229012 [Mycena haematopus]|nr:hypothetical protein B0H12DRAFT_1229012 [Mycena haematopus]
MKIKRLSYGYSRRSKERTQYKNITGESPADILKSEHLLQAQERDLDVARHFVACGSLGEIFLTWLRDFTSYRDPLVARKCRTDRRFSSVNLLLSFLSAIATIDRLTAHNEITFALLYAILVPRTLVVAGLAPLCEQNSLRPRHVLRVRVESESESASEDHCWHVRRTPPSVQRALEPLERIFPGLGATRSEPTHQPSKSPSGNSVEPTADLAKAAHRRRGAETKDAASMPKSRMVVSSGAPTTTTTSTAITSPSASPGAGVGGSPIVQSQPPQNRDALSERLQPVAVANATGKTSPAKPVAAKSTPRVCDRLDCTEADVGGRGRDSMLGRDLADLLGTGGRDCTAYEERGGFAEGLEPAAMVNGDVKEKKDDEEEEGHRKTGIASRPLRSSSAHRRRRFAALRPRRTGA